MDTVGTPSSRISTQKYGELARAEGALKMPKKTRKKRRELLTSEKQGLCLFKKENPKATRVEIAHHFRAKWGRQITLSAVKEVLSKKEHWLSIPCAEYSENQTRIRSNKVREVENALYVGLCDMASSTSQPVTSKIIRSLAKDYSNELVSSKVKFSCSNGWFGGFKRRFGIHLASPCSNKSEYGFEHVHRTRESLMDSICNSSLENVYLLVPVQLCHLYNPRLSTEVVTEDTLLVFLCVNATGTDMMEPLVFGSRECTEDIDKLKYMQETEPTWGFVHWLLKAAVHIKKPAHIISAPHRFVTCLPFKDFQIQVYKTSLKSYQSLKSIFDKVVFLFKASFRQFQLTNKRQAGEDYLALCLKWIRDAWWGLPGGALHGYWHTIPEIIQTGHNCTLPHDTSKLCVAIEDIAMKRLTTSLAGTNVDPKDILNIENSIPKFDKLTVNEIINILLLYDQLLRKNQKRETEMEKSTEIGDHQNCTTSSSLPITEDKTCNKNYNSSFPQSTCNNTLIKNGVDSISSCELDKVNAQINGSVLEAILTDQICFKGIEPNVTENVSAQEALAAIHKVINYLHTQTKEQKLYKDALKIWNYIDAQK